MYRDIELKEKLDRIHRKGYPAYKDLRGSYRFPGFILHIEHVQGDPFAAPSKLSVEVSQKDAGFPKELFDVRHKRIALQDVLVRLFAKEVYGFSFQAKGSGKSGIISVSRCGQEVLERTALELDEDRIKVRFEVGFPANGRAINSPELEKILFRFVPECVKRSLYYKNVDKKRVYEAVKLAENQEQIRQEIRKRGLIAFVANGSILPRESGVSDRPMNGAVRFESPESMEVEMKLLDGSVVKGMGIPQGITLIVGGGYHGKSTLLKALERGIYNHIAGDGREYVLTDPSAMKVRAEDGRAISGVDISPFINHLPNGKDTERFFTEDASGSTSQAANVVEAVASGAKVLLIDEDTSATNFMVRDRLMQSVISKEKEPITPFIDQARSLYTEKGVSTVLVAGSSGAYFYIADHILQMDAYHMLDITDLVKEKIGAETPQGAQAELSIDIEKSRTLKIGKIQKKHDQIKVKTFGKDGFSIGKENVDLKYVEQIVDAEQTVTLGTVMKYVLEQLEKNPGQELTKLVAQAGKKMQKEGPGALCRGEIPGNHAEVRIQEIWACINRYRGFGK